MNFNDHNHRGEYADTSHNHSAYDLFDVADKNHYHDGMYSYVSHDHDQSDLWSAVTDLQNSVDELRRLVKALRGTDASDS